MDMLNNHFLFFLRPLLTLKNAESQLNPNDIEICSISILNENIK